ncbi:MAG: hypothetical protein ACRC8A_21160 [Microcoleaceae cyanobacterium]
MAQALNPEELLPFQPVRARCSFHIHAANQMACGLCEIKNPTLWLS